MFSVSEEAGSFWENSLFRYLQVGETLNPGLTGNNFNRPGCLQVHHCVLSFVGYCRNVLYKEVRYPTGQRVAMTTTRLAT